MGGDAHLSHTLPFPLSVSLLALVCVTACLGMSLLALATPACLGMSLLALATHYLPWRVTACLGNTLLALACHCLPWQHTTCLGVSLLALATHYLPWRVTACLGVYVSLLALSLLALECVSVYVLISCYYLFQVFKEKCWKSYRPPEHQDN